MKKNKKNKCDIFVNDVHTIVDRSSLSRRFHNGIYKMALFSTFIITSLCVAKVADVSI